MITCILSKNNTSLMNAQHSRTDGCCCFQDIENGRDLLQNIGMAYKLNSVKCYFLKCTQENTLSNLQQYFITTALFKNVLYVFFDTEFGNKIRLVYVFEHRKSLVLIEIEKGYLEKNSASYIIS